MVCISLGFSREFNLIDGTLSALFSIGWFCKKFQIRSRKDENDKLREDSSKNFVIDDCLCWVFGIHISFKKYHSPFLSITKIPSSI